ncbi:hypothetical protein ACP70R_008410 [Stipagrostis hirtigluma subsp. patula]
MESSITKQQSWKQTAEWPVEHALLDGPRSGLRRFRSLNSTRKKAGDDDLQRCVNDDLNTPCVCSTLRSKPEDVTKKGKWHDGPKFVDRCRSMEEEKKAGRRREQLRHRGPGRMFFGLLTANQAASTNLENGVVCAKKTEKQD